MKKYRDACTHCSDEKYCPCRHTWNPCMSHHCPCPNHHKIELDDEQDDNLKEIKNHIPRHKPLSIDQANQTKILLDIYLETKKQTEILKELQKRK